MFIYSHDDAGAPPLNTFQSATLLDVFDACLVNGYGTKAGAGWTIEFSSATARVYRNDPVTGTGCYVRVEEISFDNYTVNVYSSMTDIDTGIYGTGQGLVRPRRDTSTEFQHIWFLYANNKRFAFWGSGKTNPTFNTRNTTEIPLLIVGDYVPYHNDGYNFFLMGQNNFYEWDVGQSANTLDSPIPDGCYSVHPDGITGSLPLCVQQVGMSVRNTIHGNAGRQMEPVSATGRIDLFPCYVGIDSDGYRVMGHVPNVYMPRQALVDWIGTVEYAQGAELVAGKRLFSNWSISGPDGWDYQGGVVVDYSTGAWEDD